MSKIQIICSKPGIRRNGIEHPAQALYDLDRWTKRELDAFRADPAFIVQEVSGTTVEASTIDIEATIAARVEIERTKLQETFGTAVKDAVAEKLATAKAEHDNAMDALGKKLTAAENEIATLKAAQATGSENSPPDTEAGGAGDATNASEGKKTAKK